MPISFTFLLYHGLEQLHTAPLTLRRQPLRPGGYPLGPKTYAMTGVFDSLKLFGKSILAASMSCY